MLPDRIRASQTFKVGAFGTFGVTPIQAINSTGPFCAGFIEKVRQNALILRAVEVDTLPTQYLPRLLSISG
jgi:hypothetical protein